MKKIITLVLAVALLMTSVMAFAESKGTPNINAFAKMSTKTDEKNGVITISMSKMVDRLLVNWTGRGEEPEELALDENMQATALTWGHKYMPGATPEKNIKLTWTKTQTDVLKNPDKAYLDALESPETQTGYNADLDAVTELYHDTYFEEFYKKEYADLEKENKKLPEEDRATEDELIEAAREIAEEETEEKMGYEHIQEEILDATALYTANRIYDEIVADNYIKVSNKKSNAFVVDPSVTYLRNNKGSFVLDAITGAKMIVEYKDGEIFYTTSTSPKQTTKAYPSDRAYFTVQGDWAVYYNRAGKIVGIEIFEGQF